MQLEFVAGEAGVSYAGIPMRAEACQHVGFVSATRTAITGLKTDDGSGASCTGGGTLLHNGICSHPPHRLTAPPTTPTEPDYLTSPPAVINVSLGRQLFCDSFLIQQLEGVRLTPHAAVWDKHPLLPADKPWETIPITQLRAPGWPAEASALAYAHPYSGGLWYDEERRVYRLWYVCSLWGGKATTAEPWRREHVDGWTGGACYAESPDGITWVKPEQDIIPGTNIVLAEVSDGIIVCRGPDGNWLMATVPEKHACMAFSLYSSEDGYHWENRVNKSGPILDRSTVFYDAFRSRWVASIKDNFGKKAHLPYESHNSVLC